MHAYVSRMWAAAMDRAASIEIGDLFPLTAFEQTRRSWATSAGISTAQFLRLT